MNAAPPESAPETRRTRVQLRLSRAAHIAGYAFLAIYIVARNVIRNDGQPLALRIAMGVLLATALAYLFWRSERDLMASKDELEQKIRVEAMAAALPLALGAVLLLGALAECGIIVMRPFHYWLPILFIYLGTLAWSRRRYR
jgi:hypothetical protein